MLASYMHHKSMIEITGRLGVDQAGFSINHVNKNIVYIREMNPRERQIERNGKT
jgi:hypothetical protein